MSVSFPSYRGGILNFDLQVLEYAMYSESISPAQYAYTDPQTGISFQKISKTFLFIADPAYPITKAIVDDEYQISYDATYSGFNNLKFVLKGQDASVSGNWKDINDVLALQKYKYQGVLPITSLEKVYMKVVKVADQSYTVGTLFTPSQPFIKLAYTYVGSVASPIPANFTFARLGFDTISDTLGNEEKDTAQITAIITGNDRGCILLSAAGRYMIQATFRLNEAATSPYTTTFYAIGYKLNGTEKEKTMSALALPASGATLGTATLTTVILVKENDLTDSTYTNKARLEIIGAHDCANVRNLEWNTPYVNCTVLFLG